MKLFKFRSLSNLEAPNTDLRRAFSEAHLGSITELETLSTLTVNTSRVDVGGKVTVSWQICEPCHPQDWIGLFLVENYDGEDCLDSKTKNIGKISTGAITWIIPKDLDLKEAVNKCQFEYRHGLTGDILASSRIFYVCVPYSLMKPKMPPDQAMVSGAETLLVVSVAGLRACGLKKSFFGKPNPYCKLCIVPRFRYLASLQRHHGQKAKTFVQNNAVNPVWENEVHVFHATGADLLELEVYNKGGARPTLGKFLGKVSLPLAAIIDSIGYDRSKTVTQPLVGRTPADKIQGTFSVTIVIRQSAQRGRYSSQCDEQSVQPRPGLRPSQTSAPFAFPEYSSSEDDDELEVVPRGQHPRPRPHSCFQLGLAPIHGSSSSNNNNGASRTMSLEEDPHVVHNGSSAHDVSNGIVSASSTSEGDDRSLLYANSPASSSGLSSDTRSSGGSYRQRVRRARSSSAASSSLDDAQPASRSFSPDDDVVPSPCPTVASQESVQLDLDESASSEAMTADAPSYSPAVNRLVHDFDTCDADDEDGDQLMSTDDGLIPPSEPVVMEPIQLERSPGGSRKASLKAAQVQRENEAAASRLVEQLLFSLPCNLDEVRLDNTAGDGVGEAPRDESPADAAESLHDVITCSPMTMSTAGGDRSAVAGSNGDSGVATEPSGILLGSADIRAEVNDQRPPRENAMTDVVVRSRADVVVTADAGTDDIGAWPLGASAHTGGVLWHDNADDCDPIKPPIAPRRSPRRPVSMFDAGSAIARNKSGFKAIFDVDSLRHDKQTHTAAQRNSWDSESSLRNDTDPTGMSSGGALEEAIRQDRRAALQPLPLSSHHTHPDSPAAPVRETCLLGDEFSDGFPSYSATSPSVVAPIPKQSPNAITMRTDVMPSLHALISHVPAAKRPLCHTLSDPTSSLRRKHKDDRMSPKSPETVVMDRRKAADESESPVAGVTCNKNFPLSRTDEAADVERSPVPLCYRRRPQLASNGNEVQPPSGSSPTTEHVARQPTTTVVARQVDSVQRVDAILSDAPLSVRPRPRRKSSEATVDTKLVRQMRELPREIATARSLTCEERFSSETETSAFLAPVANSTQPQSCNDTTDFVPPAAPIPDATDTNSVPDHAAPHGITKPPRHQARTDERSRSDKPVAMPPVIDRRQKPARRSGRRENGRAIPNGRDSNTATSGSGVEMAGARINHGLDSISRKAAAKNVRQKAAELQQVAAATETTSRANNNKEEPRKQPPPQPNDGPVHGHVPRALASRGRATPRQTNSSAAVRIIGGGRPPEIIRTTSRDDSAAASAQKRPLHVTLAATDNSDESLPQNWERAVDSHNRVYYIDHTTRTTTWDRPTRTNNQAKQQQDHDVNTQLAQLDRRYRSLRRTISDSESRQSDAASDADENDQSLATQTTADSRAGVESAPALPEPAVVSQPTSGTGPRRGPSVPRRVGSLADTPGCRFLLRRDFFQFVNNHAAANRFVQQNAAILQIASRIRSEPRKFERYQHSRDLITLLNFFANKNATLPAGWEQKVDQFGQMYFIDHGKRGTSFIDPRLPLESGATPRQSLRTTEPPPPPQARQTTAPPPASRTGGSRPVVAPRPARAAPLPPPPPSFRQGASGMTTTTQVPCSSYNDRVVAFLRQPDVDSVLVEKFTNYNAKHQLRRKINMIQRDGARVVEKYCNDVELVILLSMFDEEIQSYAGDLIGDNTPAVKAGPTAVEPRQTIAAAPPTGRLPAPYKRDFEAKLRTFHKQMISAGYAQGPGKIRMKIRRAYVIEDAYEQVMRQSARALRQDRLYIKFTGEEGLDYGGPAREFFFLLSRQLFNPYYGLFEYSASDTYTLQVSPASQYVDNAHNWFRFCGRILALALIHQHLLDVFFARTIYKALLRQPFDLSDLEGFDSEYHQSLTWILENDITHAGLDLTFSVSDHIFGKVTERELKPGGEHINVTEKNKREYVELMVKWRVERGVGEQINHLIRGFNEALELPMISLFDARELELVIAGTADIDLKEWRTNTEYRSGYHDKHQTIEWFWMALAGFTNEQNLRLLQFVTGTSSIPCEGFAALRGSTGLKRFTIDCWGAPDMLPRAHTCFNRLDLPPYRTFTELQEKLLYATEETCSFGIE